MGLRSCLPRRLAGHHQGRQLLRRRRPLRLGPGHTPAPRAGRRACGRRCRCCSTGASARVPLPGQGQGTDEACGRCTLPYVGVSVSQSVSSRFIQVTDCCSLSHLEEGTFLHINPTGRKQRMCCEFVCSMVVAVGLLRFNGSCAATPRLVCDGWM